MRPRTAAMMIAARVACGNPSNNRRQVEHRRNHERSDDQPRETRPDTCTRPDRATGEACVDREALEQACPDIGRAERDQLLVRVDFVATFGRKRTRGTDRLGQRQERQGERPGAQGADLAEADVGDGETRKAGGHIRYHRDTVGREVEVPAAADRDDADNERPGNPRRDPPEHEQGDKRRAAHGRRQPGGPVERAEHTPHRLRHLARLDLNPEELRQLPDDDHDTDTAHEADENGTREEVSHEPEAQRTRHEQRRAGEQRQAREEDGVLRGRVRRRHGHEHRGRCDGNRRARPHVELPAGAEDGVEDARPERGEEACLRRCARERRVGDRLWHEHGPDGERRDGIAERSDRR